MVIGVLGIFKAGGAYLPLDPAYPKERLAFMLQDAHAPLVLTRQHWLESLPDCAARVLCLDSGWDTTPPVNDDNPVSGATARSLAYVIYTSGSTGQPKGVMGEHGGLANYLRWICAGPLSEPTFCLPLTTKLTFDMSLKQLFPPLLRGGEVWMLPEEVVAAPALLLSALAARTRVATQLRAVVMDEHPARDPLRPRRNAGRNSHTSLLRWRESEQGTGGAHLVRAAASADLESLWPHRGDRQRVGSQNSAPEMR